MTDLEIARSVSPQPISRIAEKLGLNPESLEPYGKTKAKIPLEALRDPQGQLVLVTAISPTPAGEGKTTVTVGLTDGLNRIGARA
ncbi:MAG: formate--tetrahydrofolate ligase, partial [Schleiferiaceae bacterium]